MVRTKVITPRKTLWCGIIKGFWDYSRFWIFLIVWIARHLGLYLRHGYREGKTYRCWLKSGEQSCRKQKLWTSDIIGEKSPLSGAKKHSDF